MLKLPIWPKRLFWQFHFSDIVLLIVLYHAARFAESCYSRSSDIGFHNIGKKWAKFFHLAGMDFFFFFFFWIFTPAIFIYSLCLIIYSSDFYWLILKVSGPKEIFLKEMFFKFSGTWFLSIYFPLSCWKRWTNLINETWNLGLLNFQRQSGQHCSIGPKGRGFFKKFLKVIFIYLFSSTNPQV